MRRDRGSHATLVSEGTDEVNRTRIVALAQALYFVPTGLWAICHLRSFEAITGPKVDRWLVRTVGALVAVIGVAIGSAGYRNRVQPETVILAAGSTAALGVIDVIYVVKRRISPIYLLDAIGETLFLVAWTFALRRGK
jgi:UDP-N-acetylmuramyl pentapeptide phosphotransferase/UDP-N-acetylglucosamine-1-phosphate transferase